MRMLGGDADEAIAAEIAQLRLVERGAHPGAERPGEDRHVLDRGVGVRRDLVTVRELEADRERARRRRVTLEHRDLGPWRQNRRRRAPGDALLTRLGG